MTVKIDFKKKDKELYKASSKTPGFVTVPKMQFLMIDGEGHPGLSEQFSQATESLYGLAYTLKFLFKEREKPEGYFDYVVPPLEGLWWMKDGPPKDGQAIKANKSDWRWTLMIRQPDFFTKEMIEEARGLLKEKKNPVLLNQLYIKPFEEGLSVQIMYIGPYDQEMPTIERMHQYAQENGYQLRDKHHEIYLSDPRRTAPEKLKTILRHPVEKI